MKKIIEIAQKISLTEDDIELYGKMFDGRKRIWKLN